MAVCGRARLLPSLKDQELRGSAGASPSQILNDGYARYDNLSRNHNLLDPYRRVRLAMPLETTVILATLEVLNVHFRRWKIDDLADDAGAVNHRLADLGVLVPL